MDEHLDTSWCPVCDRQILPKRYSVPIIPPQPILPTQPTTAAPTTTTASNNAVKQSQTTRGKHGTIKARVQGGGLLHGTGRVRPGGGLRRDSGHNVPALQQNQHPTTNTNAGKRLSPQKLAAIQQQEQTRQLEAARQAQQAQIDLAAAQPRQRTVIDQAQTPLYCSDECMRQDLELSLSAATTQPIHTTRARLGMHPSQLNPERASPPPPSPVLPPVPPNSYRTPGLRLSMSEESDADADSSSATGTSFSNSEASHSHSSPVEVGEWRREKEEKDAQEGLMSVAARKLSTFFSTGNARQAREEATRRDRAALEARLRASPPNKPVESSAAAVDELPKISTSHSDSNRPGLSNAQRAQSAIELYSKYPLFTKNNKAKPRAHGTLAASPTVSASYQPASGIIDAAPAPIRTSHSRARSTASSTVEGRPRSVDRVSIFDEDGALAPAFAGRKLNKAYTSQSPRPILAKGLEGRLLVPDVLLKPSGSASGSLGDNSSPVPRVNSMASLRMTRSRSEASVPRASVGAGAGVKSALGSVKEEGAWHRPAEKAEKDGDEAGSEASASASASGSSGVRKGRRGSGSSRSRSSKDPSRAGLKLHERGRLNMEGELSFSSHYSISWYTDNKIAYSSCDMVVRQPRRTDIRRDAERARLAAAVRGGLHPRRLRPRPIIYIRRKGVRVRAPGGVRAAPARRGGGAPRGARGRAAARGA